MKRKGNLIGDIVDLNNLYEAYYKSAKGKHFDVNVISYQANLYQNLCLLSKQILSGSVDIGHYHYFTIYEPKERLICAASFPERVLHHAIMNVCHPIFDNYQIEDSYATRVGKGQYKAIERVKQYTDNNIYFAKLDVRKYFDSVNHDILKKLLRRRIKDKQLLEIFDKIIDSYSVQTFPKLETLEKLNQVEPKTGIPIGNLTSQYFANYYLAYADRYAKQTLKIQSYVRYMDDIVICENDKLLLKKNVLLLEEYMKKELSLSLKPKILNSINNGIPFLGYRIFKTKILLLQKSKQRFACKLKCYYHNLNTGKWSQQEFQLHALPLFAFTQKSNSQGLRRRLLIKLEGNNQGFESRESWWQLEQ